MTDKRLFPPFPSVTSVYSVTALQRYSVYSGILQRYITALQCLQRYSVYSVTAVDYSVYSVTVFTAVDYRSVKLFRLQQISFQTA